MNSFRKKGKGSNNKYGRVNFNYTEKIESYLEQPKKAHWVVCWGE